MFFIISGWDHDSGLEHRLQIRPRHRAHYEALGDDLILSGPYLDDKGDPIGSMIVVRRESHAGEGWRSGRPFRSVRFSLRVRRHRQPTPRSPIWTPMIPGACATRSTPPIRRRPRPHPLRVGTLRKSGYRRQPCFQPSRYNGGPLTIEGPGERVINITDTQSPASEAVFYASNDLTISGLTIGDDENTTNGAGVYTNGPIPIDVAGMTFSNLNETAVVAINTESITIDDSTFTGNATSTDGAAVFLVNTSAEITDSTFSGNEADEARRRGLPERSGHQPVDDHRFPVLRQNRVTGSNDGGAIRRQRGHGRYHRVGGFDNNTGETTAGRSSSAVWTRQRSRTRRSPATRPTGRVARSTPTEGPLTVTASTFTGNEIKPPTPTFPANGGAVAGQGTGTMSIADSTFTTITRRTWAAPWRSSSAAGTISGSTFSGNISHRQRAVER